MNIQLIYLGSQKKNHKNLLGKIKNGTIKIRGSSQSKTASITQESDILWSSLARYDHSSFSFCTSWKNNIRFKG